MASGTSSSAFMAFSHDKCVCNAPLETNVFTLMHML